MAQPGDTLQQRYHILRRIGGGGMGTVYQAEDNRLPGRRCAIKEMSPAELAPGDRNWSIQAFRQEAQMLANLHHPGLTGVTDFFAEQGRWYLVMDYVEGQTLEARLNRAPGARFPMKEALEIIRQLFDVLEYLHSQRPPVVFRDLKPGNVMCTPEGKIKLIDFGIARFFKPGQTQDTMNLGTPGYAAPEQYGGMGQSDPRSDVYSLGVLLNQMVTGYNPTSAITPFPLPDPATLGANVPPQVAEVIRRATQMQPEMRYANAAEMRQALFSPRPSAPARRSPSRTPPPRERTQRASPPPPQSSGNSGSNKGLWMGLAGGAVLVLLCGIAVFAALSTGLLDFSSNEAETAPIETTQPPTTESVDATEELTDPAPVVEETTEAVESEESSPVPTEEDTPTTPPTTVPPRLTYVSGNVGNTDVYVADADGRNRICVACQSCDEAEPAWSPDGRYVIFQSDCAGSYDIWWVESQGGTPQRLTRTADVDEREPDWSPTGSQIVYRVNGVGSGRNEDGTLHLMNSDGSNVRSLNVSGRSPVWSPDGAMLVFMSERDGSWEIYTYSLNNGSTQKVTQCTANCRWPAWSPDGRSVIYHTTTGPGSVTADSIWIAPLYGGNTYMLTHLQHPGRPSWSESGFIAFNSDQGIEIVTENGDNRRTLISSDQNWAPIWSK
ncbi:MAG: protein kinase domain-containing protein [Anaerolineae bacterium]